jgi:ethanolamine utilization protein EutA
MNRKIIHSVGIDIGTTTTQVIFSCLTLVNRAPASQVSRYEFVERKIIYQSPVSLTPIDAADAIDPEALHRFILEQFASAGLAQDDIETGAIIITGETAKASNAREALLDLSQQLGDFVVATAGPHLESRIAGRGSGAAERARLRHQRVMNIDVGGGTSNYAVFMGDRVTDTACLNVGGRLIETDQQGRVLRIHAPARRIITSLFSEPLTESQISLDHLRRIAAKMADLIVRCARGEPDELASHLLMTPSLAPCRVDALSLSGGVGACYQQLQHEALSDFTFGDIGVLLAKALLQHPGLAELPVVAPEQTLRATVIGAGAYSLALSGSTIWVKSDVLPIRNVPVVHPDIDWRSDQPDIVQAVVGAAVRMDLDTVEDSYAIALDASMPAKYHAVQQAAVGLAQFYRQHVASEREALIVVHKDLGKALGMELQPLIQPRGLVVIDEVETRDGDYIDIGQAYFGGEIVPLTVKSLAFPA